VSGVVLGQLVLGNLLEVLVLGMVGLGMIDNPRILVRLPMPGEGRGSTHREHQHGNCKSLHGWNVAREEGRG